MSARTMCTVADLPSLIQDVHDALSRVPPGAVSPDREESKPAVAVKKSVTPDYIVCLEDGKKFKSLKRHLRTHYKLSPDEYRAKWNLPARLSDGGAELCGRPVAAGEEDGARARAARSKLVPIGTKQARMARDIVSPMPGQAAPPLLPQGAPQLRQQIPVAMSLRSSISCGQRATSRGRSCARQ